MDTSSFQMLNKVQEDLRTGPAHISLMAAILKINEEQKGNGTLEILGRELRKVARIGGKGTYYKYMADLQRFGYIRYVAFCNHKRVGRIEIL